MLRHCRILRNLVYRLNFGKYKGHTLDEVPQDYLHWLRTEFNSKYRPDLAAALEQNRTEVVVKQNPVVHNDTTFNENPKSGTASDHVAGVAHDPTCGVRGNFGTEVKKLPVYALWENFRKLNWRDWRDQRFLKRNANQPDFVHKETDQGLWVHSTIDWFPTPDWVLASYPTNIWDEQNNLSRMLKGSSEETKSVAGRRTNMIQEHWSIYTLSRMYEDLSKPCRFTPVQCLDAYLNWTEKGRIARECFTEHAKICRRAVHHRMDVWASMSNLLKICFHLYRQVHVSFWNTTEGQYQQRRLRKLVSEIDYVCLTTLNSDGVLRQETGHTSLLSNELLSLYDSIVGIRTLGLEPRAKCLEAWCEFYREIVFRELEEGNFTDGYQHLSIENLAKILKTVSRLQAYPPFQFWRDFLNVCQLRVKDDVETFRQLPSVLVQAPISWQKVLSISGNDSSNLSVEVHFLHVLSEWLRCDVEQIFGEPRGNADSKRHIFVAMENVAQLLTEAVPAVDTKEKADLFENWSRFLKIATNLCVNLSLQPFDDSVRNEIPSPFFELQDYVELSNLWVKGKKECSRQELNFREGSPFYAQIWKTLEREESLNRCLNHGLLPCLEAVGKDASQPSSSAITHADPKLVGAIQRNMQVLSRGGNLSGSTGAIRRIDGMCLQILVKRMCNPYAQDRVNAEFVSLNAPHSGRSTNSNALHSSTSMSTYRNEDDMNSPVNMTHTDYSLDSKVHMMDARPPHSNVSHEEIAAHSVGQRASFSATKDPSLDKENMPFDLDDVPLLDYAEESFDPHKEETTTTPRAPSVTSHDEKLIGVGVSRATKPLLY